MNREQLGAGWSNMPQTASIPTPPNKSVDASRDSVFRMKLY